MSIDKNQPSPKNQTIANRFAKNALIYDSHASLQREIAGTLALCLPNDYPKNILEIGSGTGLLTSHIIETYPETPITISDLTPEMIAICMEKFHKFSNVKFSVLNGECIEARETYDLIAASMTIHWFTDMRAALTNIQECLSPGGNFYFSTIGPACFPEWRKALTALGLDIGIRDVPDLPGIFHKETITINYGSPLEFLKSLSRVGAHTPRNNYTKLTRRELISAMNRLDEDSQSNVTWEILYGKISAL